MNDYSALVSVIVAQCGAILLALVSGFFALLKWRKDRQIASIDTVVSATIEQMTSNSTIMANYNDLVQTMMERDKRFVQMNYEIEVLKSGLEDSRKRIEVLEKTLEIEVRLKNDALRRITELEASLDAEIRRRFLEIDKRDREIYRLQSELEALQRQVLQEQPA